MEIKIKDLNAGDFVYCTGNSGFCYSDTEKVEKTTVQYDEHSGDPYKVIWLSGGRKFDSRDGCAMNPPTAYYIVSTEQESARQRQEEIDKEKAEQERGHRDRESKKNEILAKLTKEEREILGI